MCDLIPSQTLSPGQTSWHDVGQADGEKPPPLTLVVRRQETISEPGGDVAAMKVATGTVVDGKVVVEGETLAEGETVTVLLRDNGETFELTSEEEDEILDQSPRSNAVSSFPAKSSWNDFVGSGESTAANPCLAAGSRSNRGGFTTEYRKGFWRCLPSGTPVGVVLRAFACNDADERRSGCFYELALPGRTFYNGCKKG